jgi:tRNA threonylcarbamoyladenosine biosynthesis protein TsaB
VRALAVDTTTPRGSIAVLDDGLVLAEARVTTAEGHSRWLLPAVDALLGGLGVAPAALDCFVVTTGPGSFTGLRVGLSSVQGLALASRRPCVGLSALDALALAAAGSADTIVALMDAFRGEVYAAAYDRAGAPRGSARVGVLEDVLDDVPPGSAFVGDAAVGERRRIQSQLPGATFPEIELFLAVPLGRAGLARAAAGQAVAATELRPVYLRSADIRVPKR